MRPEIVTGVNCFLITGKFTPGHMKFIRDLKCSIVTDVLPLRNNFIFD
ncbi:hypothetical protein MuYL_2081 [Mucilaginibacter xinganensis]|uniref:Uncharacterized protein n=1 Tax=Mucilaginibacter xinganensis TaxID=1234841 RepID=A0A223NVR7_9SPHI|nr:hypothetical protein MuYL_2081 [Mucilaginibacter xinganensis]